MELLNTAKANNQYITDYIKFADTKVAGFITISSAISSLVLPSLYKWLGLHEINGLYLVYWTLLILGNLLFIGTIVSSLLALSPKATRANSLVSFPDIHDSSINEYTSRFLKLNNTEITEEYLKHNKTLSEIAFKKFKWIKIATRCCFGWIIIFGVLYLIYGATAIK